jgi:hypothetical protein
MASVALLLAHQCPNGNTRGRRKQKAPWKAAALPALGLRLFRQRGFTGYSTSGLSRGAQAHSQAFHLVLDAELLALEHCDLHIIMSRMREFGCDLLLEIAVLVRQAFQMCFESHTSLHRSIAKYFAKQAEYDR